MDLSARRPGPDVVRALAMTGVVVMNYHGYLILLGAPRTGGVWYDLFDPWTGPLSTRFAATFVLTAGVGVTLMTRRSLGDRAATTSMRWRLARRGLVLYFLGLALDRIWEGTILTYYGAMFAIAALLITLRIRWVVLIGVVAALAGWGIRWFRLERQLDGRSTRWLTNPDGFAPEGVIFDLFVNGTHPLLPWLAFFCAGIVLGRVVSISWWRPVAVATSFVLFTIATLVGGTADGPRSGVLLNDDPFDRGGVYVASALGTALLAFAAISWIADRFESVAPVDWLRRAGQLSLTIYLGHVLVFNLLVEWTSVIEPGGLGTALTFAMTYWLLATAAAVAYQRRFGRGPAETVYRMITR